MKTSSLLPLAATLFALAASRAHADPARSHHNPIPPRLQWEANKGYCGEVSLISAGLYYGQYMSQYQARICAIGGQPQNEGEMLLGKNDRKAARAMHLESTEWDIRKQHSTGQFLLWVKRNVLRGYPVIIGVYNNEFQLYGNPGLAAGDPQYDHIVTVMRIRSHHPLGSRGFFGNDSLTLSDNGLFGSKGHYPYHFSYSFAGFPGDRAQANQPSGPLYTLPNYGRNYGVVITGVADRDGDTLPVRVKTNKNYERPSMPRGGTKRPRPEKLQLTVTVSGLTPGIAYKLYRYDELDRIPDAEFNARAADALQTWDILIGAGTTFAIKQDILSDEIAAYRCVRADAP